MTQEGHCFHFIEEKTECLKTSEIAAQKHENFEFTSAKIESDTSKGKYHLS